MGFILTVLILLGILDR